MVTNSSTLGDAKQWLRERVDEGAGCPCCEQFAKVYRRQIHSTMARDLIRLHRVAGFEWTHVPTALGSGGRSVGDLAKTAYWGLIEGMPGVREDGSTRSGWWRVTDRGSLYVQRNLIVHKYARVYDGRCLGFDGVLVDVRDALGDRFDYDELMSA